MSQFIGPGAPVGMYMGNPPTGWLLRRHRAEGLVLYSHNNEEGASQPMNQFTDPGAPVGMYKVCGVQYDSTARSTNTLTDPRPQSLICVATARSISDGL